MIRQHRRGSILIVFRGLSHFHSSNDFFPLIPLRGTEIPVRIQNKTTQVKIPTGSGSTQGLVTYYDVGTPNGTAMVSTADTYTREFDPQYDNDDTQKDEVGRVVMPPEEKADVLRSAEHTVRASFHCVALFQMPTVTSAKDSPTPNLMPLL